MLGNHGIRFSLKHEKILEAELKAIKKCAEKFKSKIFGIMFPQIVSAEEISKAKEVCKKLGILNMKNVKIGIMVETPAACLIIKHLLKTGVDFISFGTNDLTQYTLAIDRNNESIQYMYDEMHPAVLNAIKRVLRTCEELNVESSICGQAGSNKKMVEFLIENGINSISLNSDAAYEISKYIAELENKKVNDERKKDEGKKDKLKQAKQAEKEENTEEKIQKITKKIEAAIGNEISKAPILIKPQINKPKREESFKEYPIKKPEIPTYVANIKYDTKKFKLEQNALKQLFGEVQIKYKDVKTYEQNLKSLFDNEEMISDEEKEQTLDIF